LIPGMLPKRMTYIVSVRDTDGPATVEETRTGRKARLGSLKELGAQIERWLREARTPGRREGDER
jgi:hypothetical protein